jgi:GTP pyrophosphokinase
LNQTEEQTASKTIYVWWQKDIEYKLGKCMECSEEYRESSRIIAHINSKGIITVHRLDCPELEFVNKERLINAFYEWDENASLFVDIHFTFYNKIWVLKELSWILFGMNINVMGISTESQSKSKLLMKFTLEIQECDYLKIDRLIDRVKFHLEQTYCDHKIVNISS